MQAWWLGCRRAAIDACWLGCRRAGWDAGVLTGVQVGCRLAALSCCLQSHLWQRALIRLVCLWVCCKQLGPKPSGDVGTSRTGARGAGGAVRLSRATSISAPDSA